MDVWSLVQRLTFRRQRKATLRLNVEIIDASDMASVCEDLCALANRTGAVCTVYFEDHNATASVWPEVTTPPYLFGRIKSLGVLDDYEGPKPKGAI